MVQETKKLQKPYNYELFQGKEKTYKVSDSSQTI